jgi:formimidoylglutamate deiminase
MVKFHFEWVLLESGWTQDITISVEQGVIVGLESGDAPADASPIRGFSLPGLTSLHSHAFQRGMAGLAETRGQGAESFWTWREVMYRFLDRLTPDDVASVAAQAYLEMLETGFTAVTEFHYLHHDNDGRPYADPAEMAVAIAQAASSTDIGLTLLPVLYRFGNFGEVPAGHGQRRFLNSPDGFERLVAASEKAVSDLEGAVTGVALHSLRAVAPDDVARLAALRPKAPIHIHAAEQEKEVADCIAWSGKRPIQWLLDHAGLDPRWCVIHATHLDSTEVEGLARSGAVAGLCPITESNLGDGIFPATDFRRHGGRYGIGTDSNVLISAAEELRVLEYSQRLRDRQRVRLADAGQSVGTSILKAALAGGAQASGRKTGLIAVGCRADWITLEVGHPAFADGDMANLIDRAIFAMPVLPVEAVWIGGRQVMSEGCHPQAEAIRSSFAKTMRGLRERI